MVSDYFSLCVRCRQDCSVLSTYLRERLNIAFEARMYKLCSPSIKLSCEFSIFKAKEHQSSRAVAALMTAGETAAVCSPLELDALWILCGHAARCPAHRPLVRAQLETLAHRLGYPSLPQYLACVAVPLADAWVSNGFSVQELVDVQVLFLKSLS